MPMAEPNVESTPKTLARLHTHIYTYRRSHTHSHTHTLHTHSFILKMQKVGFSLLPHRHQWIKLAHSRSGELKNGLLGVRHAIANDGNDL